MISIGAHFGGPGHGGSAIDIAISLVTQAISKERGPLVGIDEFGPCDPRPAAGRFFELGSVPAVNVVFHVPGSVSAVVPTKIEAARFSRKQKLLLVAVPVPPEMINSDKALDFVIDALRQANAIAADIFSKKKVGAFDLQRAEEIVENVEACAKNGTGVFDSQNVKAVVEKLAANARRTAEAVRKAKEVMTAHPK
jgi:hypothetical protein